MNWLPNQMHKVVSFGHITKLPHKTRLVMYFDKEKASEKLGKGSAESLKVLRQAPWWYNNGRKAGQNHGVQDKSSLTKAHWTKAYQTKSVIADKSSQQTVS